LNAVRDINLNQAITTTGGNLLANAGRDMNLNGAATTTNGSFSATGGRDVNLNAALTATDGSVSAIAGRDVNVSAAMTTTRGNLLLRADNDGTGPGLAGGSVVFLGGLAPAAVTGPNAAVMIYYNPASYAAPTDFSTHFTLSSGATLNAWMWVFGRGNNKVYDGLSTATLSLAGDPSVGGTNAVSLIPGTAAFLTPAVGTAKTVNFTGYSLGGADAGKFALFATNGITTADITPAPLSITPTSITKIYGQTPTLTGFTPIGLVNSETIGSVTETSPGAAASASVAGSPYTITASAATGGSFTPSNYSIN
jgi:hypothetical protein